LMIDFSTVSPPTPESNMPIAFQGNVFSPEFTDG